jgi:hypothetical protein
MEMVSLEAGRTAYLHPHDQPCGIVGCTGPTEAMFHVTNTDGSNPDHESTQSASFNLCCNHLYQLRKELLEAAAAKIY